MQLKNLIVIILSCLAYPEMHHSYRETTWKKEGIAPFEELVCSWNAERPKEGELAIWMRVKTDTWSPWFQYAKWGSVGQEGAGSRAISSSVKVELDVVSTKGGTGFEIEVRGGHPVHSLHVCTNNPSEKKIDPNPKNITIQLPVRGISQFALNDIRKHRLCSPTSTTSVIRYLRPEKTLSVIDFAERAHDNGADFFGNWALNVAEAYNQTKIPCWVERIESFSRVLDSLSRGAPVVISIKKLQHGNALLYPHSGHLIAIIGYDCKTDEVICMDSGHPTDGEAIQRYKREALLAAWKTRDFTAYWFHAD